MVRQKLDPPRGVLKGSGELDGRIKHERYYPSEDLAPFIEHFWIVEWDLRGREPFLAETLPHPSVHMAFYHDGRAEIGGPATAKFSTQLEDAGGVFAAKFTPAGFYPFARGPVSRFTDTKTNIGDIFGESGIALAHQIHAAATIEGRVSLLETFLRARLPAHDENVETISRMVYATANDREITKVEQLADRNAVTVRSLQRMFAKYVGVSPKWVIRRYRLHEAAEQLGNGSTVDYADLAVELGYSDQAHFLRDFKSVVGVSPGAYAKDNRSRTANR
jgi:AraC-like DNA-binding protein